MRTIFEMTIEDKLRELPEGILTKDEIMDFGIKSLRMLDGEEVFVINAEVIRELKNKGNEVYQKYIEAIVSLADRMDIELTFKKKEER